MPVYILHICNLKKSVLSQLEYMDKMYPFLLLYWIFWGERLEEDKVARNMYMSIDMYFRYAGMPISLKIAKAVLLVNVPLRYFMKILLHA